MTVIKDLNPWYDQEDYTDDNTVVLDDQEADDEDEDANDEDDDQEEEEDDDDQEEEDDDDDGEGMKINFFQVEDINMWQRKNYKLAVEVVRATGIDSDTPPYFCRQYYVIAYNNVGIVRTTRLSIGHNNSVRWNNNQLFVFPVDGFDMLKWRMEEEQVVNDDDGDGDGDDGEFIYFQIVRNSISFDEAGPSHGHVVVGQARANVPLSLIWLDCALEVVEPVRLGGGRNGRLRVRMMLSKMIPSEQEVEKWNSSVDGGDAVVVRRRRISKAIKFN